MKGSSWLRGCGLAILLMLGILWVHISPAHSDFYHRLLPLNSVYWAVGIDLAVMCVACTVVLWQIERADPARRSFWWAVVAAILMWRLNVFVDLQGWLAAKPYRPIYTLLIWACIGLALWFWSRSLYVRLVRGFLLTLALVGLCIFWMLPEVLYMAIHREPHEVPGFRRAIPKASLPQQRIIWVVFDELSQDQVFDHRQPGLNLPAFDALRANSVMFSDVNPAGYFTELVLPSLLWGKTVTGERSNLDGVLSARTEQGWARYPADQSIFADARRAGWTTGVAGWYNPYCRTFAAELDSCEWRLSTPIPGEYSPQEGIAWNILAPVRKSFLRLIGRKYRTPSNAVVHASDYTQIMDWGRQLIADEDVGLVFLHLPIPHPYGIYNRRTGALGVEGSYIDNLALSDIALSQIEKWIDATKSSPMTTLIVCGDHSLRVPLWSKTPDWSAEDKQASGGLFDPRPALIVHLPGETQPETISQPFAALREHDLVEKLLKSPLAPDTLDVWARSQR